MARVFNVYKKDGTKVLDGVASPAVITGLTQNTQYASGDYQASAIDDGKPESVKVDIPAFKTKVTNVPVTGVTVSSATVTEAIGQGSNVDITVAPANATNKAWTLEGKNDAIATAVVTDNTVRITGVAEGTFTLTVKTTDGAKTATIAVTITAA